VEHRLTRRIRIPLDVVLYARGSVFGRGICRDIGLQGMYVEAEPGLLRRNTLVEVEILTAGLCLPALVVHCDKRGAGLAFDETASPEPLRHLREFLQGLEE